MAASAEIYRDPTQPVESRVRDLLSRMSLTEKACQMAQIERVVASSKTLTTLPVGSVLSAGGSAPRDRATAADWANMVDAMQRHALASRLSIPIIYASDAVHGHNNLYGATIFPHNVALGATRDAELVRKIGEATALEVRATGIHYTFAPCVAEHRELAQEAVRKSLVLLKNGKDPKKTFLPLDKNAKRLLVAGIHADDIGYQCGGWTMTWHGDSGRITTGTTILEAIKATVGNGTEVIYEERPSIMTFKDQEFSYAVVVVGEVAYAEFLGDRWDLNIPLGGDDIINLVASRVPTLVIMISGRPLVFEPELLNKIEALVAAWLPGSEGGGVTDVVFGDYDFEGVLPVTWFKSVNQLPVNAEHQSYDPLFPIGFGLKMGLGSNNSP